MLILDLALFAGWLMETISQPHATATNTSMSVPFALQAAIMRANSHCASLTRK